jgi:flagellar basal body P-ring formation protein FlgA
VRADALGGKLRAPRGDDRPEYAIWHVACLSISTMRVPSKSRRWVLGLSLAAGPLCSAPVRSADLQDISELEALARSAAQLHLPALTDKQRLVAGPIAAYSQLERCSLPVTPLVGPGAHMRDRVLVELRCAGVRPWHIYVPVRIVGISLVTVAARAIVAGTVLSDRDVRVEQRAISELPPGYLDDPTVAVGLTASRAISSGAVVTNQFLVASKAVQRGQMVTLVAEGGGLNVRMSGRALSDGLVNQRVRVQNLSSGKIIEGIARSEQVVEIIFQ